MYLWLNLYLLKYLYPYNIHIHIYVLLILFLWRPLTNTEGLYVCGGGGGQERIVVPLRVLGPR